MSDVHCYFLKRHKTEHSREEYNTCPGIDRIRLMFSWKAQIMICSQTRWLSDAVKILIMPAHSFLKFAGVVAPIIQQRSHCKSNLQGVDAFNADLLMYSGNQNLYVFKAICSYSLQAKKLVPHAKK